MPALNQFADFEATYRGVTYKMKEIDAETYDELLKQATNTKFDADGNETEAVDEPLLFRLMLQASLVAPAVSSLDLQKMGFRLVRQLERDCQRLHFAIEPETDKRGRSKGKAEEEETPNAEGA